MRKRYLVPLFALGALALLPPSAGATDVSGTIATTAWTAANSPYRVTGAVTVPSGETLTIEPGVDVLFDADVEFTVTGVLNSAGDEADSVRFMAGTATQWGGIRVSGGNTSQFTYTRISDGYAAGSYPNGKGGAIYLADTGTRAEVSNCVFTDNRADLYGGAIAGWFYSELAVDQCTFRGNEAGTGGGAILTTFCHATITNSVFTDNVGTTYGGAIMGESDTVWVENCLMTGNTSNMGAMFVHGADPAVFYITNCTITGNIAPYGYASLCMESSDCQVDVRNCIIWDGGEYEVWNNGTTATIAYSNVMTGVPTNVTDGGGNISADPMFADSAAGDFSLTAGSPCVDTGDPSSELDADGSRADMGAIRYNHLLDYQFSLPTVTTQSGVATHVGVTAYAGDISSATLAFLADASVIDSVTVYAHAFSGLAGEQATVNMSGDTVFVALAAGETTTLNNDKIVELILWVNPSAPVTTIPLAWVAEETTVDEQSAALTDGSLAVAAYYGDVTGNGSITADDATWVLEYLVRIRSDIDVTRADVSGNGRVRAYDAALIIARVINPGYVFPVEGGGSLERPSATAARVLSVREEGSDWVLTMDNASGIVSGEISLSTAGNGSFDVSGASLIAANRTGDVLRVSFVRNPADGNELFRLRPTDAAAMPTVLEAEVNEGAIDVAIAAPLCLSLGQNTPNPFNPTTAISFTLPEAGHATLAVYTVTGQLVRTLADGSMQAGQHVVDWNGRDALGHDVATGIYLYRLVTAQGAQTRRMVLAR